MVNFGCGQINEFYPLEKKQSIIPFLPAGKSEIYEEDLSGVFSSFNPNVKVYSDIDIKDFELHARERTSRDVAKVLLSERISGKSFADLEKGVPYLDYYALTQGDSEIDDLDYKINLSSQCEKSVVWFIGDESGDEYVKKIDCRKQWCNHCGGKGGAIHKSRMHSILRRFDINKYNLRQLVFTVPESFRELLLGRENLNLFIFYAKQTVEKFFGVPIYDKRGHVRGYKLEKGVIFYLHIFGDELGIFKPHVNVHILEDKSEKLKIEGSVLDEIKKYYLKKLRKFDTSCEDVDVHYSFRIGAKRVMHALKYMCRPWSAEDFSNIKNEDLKRLLVLELSGFQYLRFTGALANCNYKDEMELPDIIEECQSKVEEKLIPVCISPFDENEWKDRLIYIDKGFFRIKKKGLNNEPEKCKEITTSE